MNIHFKMIFNDLNLIILIFGIIVKSSFYAICQLNNPTTILNQIEFNSSVSLLSIIFIWFKTTLHLLRTKVNWKTRKKRNRSITSFVWICILNVWIYAQIFDEWQKIAYLNKKLKNINRERCHKVIVCTKANIAIPQLKII